MKVSAMESTVERLSEELQTSNDRLNKLNIEFGTMDEYVKDLTEKKVD